VRNGLPQSDQNVEADASGGRRLMKFKMMMMLMVMMTMMIT
jgi:hypothetical protein